MILINQIGNLISGHCNGKSFSVSFSKEKWDAMQQVAAKANNAETMADLKAAITEFEPMMAESYKEVVETASPYIAVNSTTNQFFLNYKGVVYDSVPMPPEFAEKILKSIELNISPDPFIKAWIRWCKNPNVFGQPKDKALAKSKLFVWYLSQTTVDQNKRAQLMKEGISEERATELSTSMQTPITQEGLICTYKVSKEITERYRKVTDANGIESVVKGDFRPFEVDPITGLKKYAEPVEGVDGVEDRYFEPAVMGNRGDKFELLDYTAGPGDKGEAGHIIRVGKVHKLDSWSKVDCNDYAVGRPGLHVGNLDYIRAYQTPGTVTHETLVDPMHIGAIVQDGTGALRVLQYFTHRSFAGVNRSLYHSATYGKLTDKQYELMLQELVRKQEEEMIAAQNKQQQAMNLVD